MPNLGRGRPGQFITRNPPVFTKGKKNENELKDNAVALLYKLDCRSHLVQASGVPVRFTRQQERVAVLTDITRMKLASTTCPRTT